MKFFTTQINKLFLIVFFIIQSTVLTFGDEYVIPNMGLEKIGNFSFRYHKCYNSMPEKLDDLKSILSNEEKRIFNMYKRFGYAIEIYRKNDNNILITLYDGTDNYELNYFISDTHCFFMARNGKAYCEYKLNEDGSILNSSFYNDSAPCKDDSLLPF